MTFNEWSMVGNNEKRSVSLRMFVAKLLRRQNAQLVLIASVFKEA